MPRGGGERPKSLQERPRALQRRPLDFWGAFHRNFAAPGTIFDQKRSQNISKRSPNRTKINITSQTEVSVYIRMFSDRFASLFHLSVLRKKLQIHRKGHQIRGCRFFSSSSQLRAKFEKKRAKKQPNSAEKSTPKPSKKVLISPPPPRTPPKSLQN